MIVKKFANLFCLETIAWLLIILLSKLLNCISRRPLNVFRNLNIPKLTCHRIYSNPIYSLGSHMSRKQQRSFTTQKSSRLWDGPTNQPLDGGQLKKVKWLLGKQHVLHDINFLLAIHSFNQFTWNDQVSSSSVFLSFLYLGTEGKASLPLVGCVCDFFTKTTTT